MTETRVEENGYVEAENVRVPLRFYRRAVYWTYRVPVRKNDNIAILYVYRTAHNRHGKTYSTGGVTVFTDVYTNSCRFLVHRHSASRNQNRTRIWRYSWRLLLTRCVFTGSRPNLPKATDAANNNETVFFHALILYVKRIKDKCCRKGGKSLNSNRAQHMRAFMMEYRKTWKNSIFCQDCCGSIIFYLTVPLRTCSPWGLFTAGF